MKDEMGYQQLAQEALRDMVRLALEKIERDGGVPGQHRIYIRFMTQADGVGIPPRLLAEYPNHITIVLKQHFWDLKVERDKFSVGLSFNQQPETLVVPYKAVVQLHDDSLDFTVHFPEPEIRPRPALAAPVPPPEESASTVSAVPDKDEDAADAQVVSLDAFRKK